MMLVLIGPKREWVWYVNRWICNNYSEVLGNLLCTVYSHTVAIYAIEFKAQSILLPAKVVCIVSYLSIYCFMAPVFGIHFQLIFHAVSCVASSNGI